MLAEEGVVEGAVVVDEVATDEGLGDAPIEALALKGAPATLALDALFGDGPGLALANDGDVCLIAWTQETTLLDVKEAGRVVCHECYHTLDGEHLLIDEAEHSGEGELYHGHARHCLLTASLLLLDGVRGVVGTDG